MGYENIDLEINYNDLIKDLVEGIPHLSKKWTDHNPSDFGIMILELYSFIADNYLYKINRVDAEVLYGFLRNYLLSEQELLLNASIGLDPNLKNTSLSDEYDYLWKRLGKIITANPAGDEAMLREVRRFFDEPYRLITEEDAVTICKNLVPTFKDSLGVTSYILKGIDVDHISIKHSFMIVASIGSSVPGRTLPSAEKESVVETLKKALIPRKLLGSLVSVALAKEVKVTKVHVRLRFNTKTSEWNRNGEKLIQDRLRVYLQNTARGGELSLHQVVSLFEMYSFVEELEAVDFVERITVKLRDADGQEIILNDDEANGQVYKVMYDFAGEFVIPADIDLIVVERIL